MAALDLQTAEADGVAVAAAGSFTLSPLQLAYLSNPWSTGSELYGDLAGSLQIRGEADGSAAGSATPLLQGFHLARADGIGGGFATQLTLSNLNTQGLANTSSAVRAQIGGSLQVAGEADGVGETTAVLSGAGSPVSLEGVAWGISLGNGARLSGLYSIPASGGGSAAASATIGLGISTAVAPGRSEAVGRLRLVIGLSCAIAGRSTAAGSLRINADHKGEADGEASASAAMSALAQLSGLSGEDGWQRPQLRGKACASGHACAALTVVGPVTVALSGSA